MSGDIAQLGIQIDSRSAVTAKSDLDKLVPAAKGAEAALTGLEAAAKRAGGTALPGLGDGAKKSTVDLSALDKALQATTADINVHGLALTNGTAAQGRLGAAAAAAARQTKGLSFEARNLSYQMVDVTQGVLMGQSAFQIFAQQGGQVAQVIATSPQGLGGLTRELGRSLAGLLTPGRLAIGVLGGLGVAAYAMNSAWNASALALDDTARATQTTIREFRALDSAASVAGIDDFASDAQRLAGAIYQARNGMGSLGDVLRANGESATTFTGTLQAAARILQRAGSDQQRLQLLQQMGLPATMAWVRLLSNGGDAIRKAAQAAAEMSPREQELVDKARAFDEAWTRGWRNFKSEARDAFISAKAGFSDLDSAVTSFFLKANPGATRGFVLGNALKNGSPMLSQEGANDFYGRFGSTFGKSPPIVDPNAAARGLALEQQRLSILGQTASVGQQVRLVEIQIAQARLNGVNITAREADQLRELARQRALGTDQIRAQADAYNIDAATVGMSIERAAAYAAVHERLNQARREGRVYTAEQIAEIEREAAALGAAAARADDLRFRYDTFSGTLREFGSNIRNGQNAWQAFGNAGANALGKIADRLMDMASRQLWNAAFGGSGGGGGLLGGLFGGLFGGGGGGSPTGGMGLSLTGTGSLYAKGGAFPAGNLSAFSNTVVTKPTVFPINDGPIRAFAKGAGLMGEAGPEAIMPLTRGPDGKLGVRAQGSGGPSVTINNSYTFTGVEPGMEARLRSYIDSGDKRSVEQAARAVQQANSTSGGKFLGGVR